MNRFLLALLLSIALSLGLAACAPSPSVTPTATPAAPTATASPSAEPAASPTLPPGPALQISSAAIAPGGEIPVQHACHGANSSPPLQWSGAPDETETLALLVRDADSEPPGFVHWVIYNMPGTTTGLPEGVQAEPTLPDGTLQGSNDFAGSAGQTFPGGAPVHGVGYDGPCPPGAHRYVFTIYALELALDLPSGATATGVLDAMEGHVLAEAELMGVYSPPG